MSGKGSRVTKCGEGSSGWLLTSLLPRYGCPGALNPPFCAPLGATLGAGCSRESRLPPLTPKGSGHLQDAWANLFYTIFLGLFLLRGGSTRDPSAPPAHQEPPQPQPGGLVHAQAPEGKCGTSSVLSGVEDPCQVTSDQNQLLFALWSRSWFISDGDYISVGEHLS